MGYWYKPRQPAKGKIKVIDPEPIWIVTIQREGHDPYNIFVGTEKAQEYLRAGFPVKMKTTAGALQQLDD